MNKAILIGRLTKDPEIRMTNSGNTVATFGLATNRNYKNADGERLSDFHNIVVWNKLADLIGKYCFKGDMVSITGEIQTRSYEARDGSKRYITEIIAYEVEFLTPKKSHQTRTSDGGVPEGFTEIDDEDLPF